VLIPCKSVSKKTAQSAESASKKSLRILCLFLAKYFLCGLCVLCGKKCLPRHSRRRRRVNLDNLWPPPFLAQKRTCPFVAPCGELCRTKRRSPPVLDCCYFGLAIGEVLLTCLPQHVFGRGHSTGDPFSIVKTNLSSLRHTQKGGATRGK
jgi:hypothetical protein